MTKRAPSKSTRALVAAIREECEKVGASCSDYSKGGGGHGVVTVRWRGQARKVFFPCTPKNLGDAVKMKRRDVARLLDEIFRSTP